MGWFGNKRRSRGLELFDTGYTLEGLPRSNVSPEGYDLTLVLVVAAFFAFTYNSLTKDKNRGSC